MVNKKESGGLKLSFGKFSAHVSNRWLYTFIFIFAFAIAGVFVYAQDPDVFGHHYDDLDLGPITIEGDDVRIKNGLFVKSGVGDGIQGSAGGGVFWIGPNNLGIDTEAENDIRFRNNNRNDILRLYSGNKSAKFFGDVCIGDVCKSEWPSGGESLWTQSGSDIYYDEGNVAVGTTPVSNEKLLVGGNLRINGSTLTTPFGILMKHYEPGYGDSSSRTYLRKGWTEPSGDFLYLGATGNRNNNAQTAIFLSQNSSRGLLIGRGHNDADQISTEWARINGDGLTVLGDASVDGDLTVDGSIDSVRSTGSSHNAIVYCQGGISTSGSSFTCSGPRVDIYNYYDGGLQTSVRPGVAMATSSILEDVREGAANHVCFALGGAYSSYSWTSAEQVYVAQLRSGDKKTAGNDDYAASYAWVRHVAPSSSTDFGYFSSITCNKR
ncbi:MAG: hypothetical protein WDZ69_01735 [Candidatus Pacearchaeota archaeon]